MSNFSIKTSPVPMSIGDHESANRYPAPLYFRMKESLSLSDFVDMMIDKQFAYSPIIFKKTKGNYGYRKSQNFFASYVIALDVDMPGLSIKAVTGRIKELGYNGIIIPTKNHMKEKNGIVCERYRILICCDSQISTAILYKKLCKQISLEICDGKDDQKCHDGARYFDASPKDIKDQIVYIEGENFVTVPEMSDDDIVAEMATERRTINRPVKEPISNSAFDSMLESYGKYLTSLGLKHKISHYNDTNRSINLYRDGKDKKAGCFMFIDDIKIYDNRGNKVSHADFSFNQFSEAVMNEKKGLELMRTETLAKIIPSLDIEKKTNVIITSEGLGKSSLVPDYKEKFGAKSAISVCKSYSQLANKKKMYDTRFPDLKTEIVLGAEKILENHNIHRDEWIWGRDEKTNDSFVNVIKTIEHSCVFPEVKARAIEEVERNRNIIEGTTHVDLILMVEDKLKVEVKLKDNLISKDLVIIWDEFHPDHWLEWRLATEYEQQTMDKFGRKIIDFETWNGFVSKLTKEDVSWFHKIKGSKIVLSTEDKVIKYFEDHHKFKQSLNIINIRSTFLAASKKINVWSVKQTMVIQKNKKYTADAFRSNGFIIMGNGVESKINNSSMLGQNYHDEINENDRIMLTINKPSPAELAPMMKNLKIDVHEATILILSDVLNQYFGRFCGYRSQIEFKSFDIVIPDNLINDILPNLRYVCNVNRSVVANKNKTEDGGKPRLFNKIIHTVAKNLGCVTHPSPELYMKTLTDHIIIFRRDLEAFGSDFVAKTGNLAMRFYKFTKEQIATAKRSMSILRRNVEEQKYRDIYPKDKLALILYSNNLIDENMKHVPADFDFDPLIC